MQGTILLFVLLLRREKNSEKLGREEEGHSENLSESYKKRLKWKNKARKTQGKINEESVTISLKTGKR